MQFEPTRLRAPEWAMGASALVLLVSLVVFKWYALLSPLAHTAANLGVATSLTGWQALSVLRWLILITGVLGLAVWWAQATQRAPGLPISLTVFTTLLALLSSIGIVWRVVFDPPGSYELRFGAYAAMISAILLTIAGYRSMRIDGIREPDGPGEIETISLGERAKTT